MKRILIILWMTAGFLLFSWLTPQDGMAIKCGNSAVSAGDTADEVLQKCGKPMKKEKSTIKDPESSAKKAGRILDKRSNQYKYRDKSKRVEKWYYNCGKNDFIYILTFENGRFQGEQTAGRGKGVSRCKDGK